MHLFSEVISLFIRFFVWIFRKMGINGILVLLLLIELPVVSVYYSEESKHDTSRQNYKLAEPVSMEEISIEDPRLTENGVSLKMDMKYYLATIKVENYYSSDVRYMSIEAKNQDEERVNVWPVSYYGELKYDYIQDGLSIPAGSSRDMQYIVGIPEEEVKDTSSICFYEWVYEEYGKEPTNQVTVPMP